MCRCSGSLAYRPPEGGSSVDGGCGAQGVSAGVSAGSLGVRVGVGKVSCSGPIVVLGSFEGAGAAACARVGCICDLLSRLVWVGGVEFGTGGFSRIAGFCGGARIFGLGGTGSVGAHGHGEVLGVGPLFGGLTSFLPRVVVLAYS